MCRIKCFLFVGWFFVFYRGCFLFVPPASWRIIPAYFVSSSSPFIALLPSWAGVLEMSASLEICLARCNTIGLLAATAFSFAACSRGLRRTSSIYSPPPPLPPILISVSHGLVLDLSFHASSSGRKSSAAFLLSLSLCPQNLLKPVSLLPGLSTWIYTRLERASILSSSVLSWLGSKNSVRRMVAKNRRLIILPNLALFAASGSPSSFTIISGRSDYLNRPPPPSGNSR